MRKSNSLLVFIVVFVWVLAVSLALFHMLGLEAIGIKEGSYSIVSLAISVVCGMLSVVWFICESERRNNKLRKQKPITAVLYDSKVNYVVDIVTINKPMDIIKYPDLRKGIIGRGPDDWGIKTKNYHFFCIQDNGKHVFIERS